MILVVAEKLSLSFLLQHQGRFLRSARTADEAIHALEVHNNIEGVVLDHAVPDSTLVSGYLRERRPDMQVVSWQVAQRNSPFRNVKVAIPDGSMPRTEESKEDRFVFTVRKPVPKS